MTDLVWNEAFNLLINPARPEEGGVNEVRSAGGGQDVDPTQRLHTVQLRQELVHNTISHARVIMTTPTTTEVDDQITVS